VTGDNETLTMARSTLLDALAALAAHRRAVIVIGAQAIYRHTGGAQVALAEATKDSDLALDVRQLGENPRIEDAMRAAGFQLSADRPQPGSWLGRNGIPVDLMVPESLAGIGGRRGARIPPHAKNAARRATGLEAAAVDHLPMVVRGLAPTDARTFTANVASPAALLVAKLHKLGERQSRPDRLLDKDAHDLYRRLVAVSTEHLALSTSRLLANDFAGPVTEQAMRFLAGMFAAGPEATGSVMAGRAEEGIGDPAFVAAAVSALANDLLHAL
jgi:Nucleotidyltransferase